MTQEPMEKRHRVAALISQSEEQLKEVNLNFGMEFAYSLKKRIQTLSRDLLLSLTQDNEQRIEQYYAELQNSLSDLNRIVLGYFDEE